MSFKKIKLLFIVALWPLPRWDQLQIILGMPITNFLWSLTVCCGSGSDRNRIFFPFISGYPKMVGSGSIIEIDSSKRHITFFLLLLHIITFHIFPPKFLPSSWLKKKHRVDVFLIVIDVIRLSQKFSQRSGPTFLALRIRNQIFGVLEFDSSKKA